MPPNPMAEYFMTTVTGPILVIGVVLTALLFAFSVLRLLYGCRCHGLANGSIRATPWESSRRRARQQPSARSSVLSHTPHQNVVRFDPVSSYACGFRPGSASMLHLSPALTRLAASA
jgi:hypothetical protein